MNITYYPDSEAVKSAMEQDEPLLVLISYFLGYFTAELQKGRQTINFGKE